MDEAALADALARGVIAGAGLDVYEREPEINPGLLGLDNCVLLPHIGSATTSTRERMARTAAECLVAMIEGTEIPNLVNPDYIQPPSEGVIRCATAPRKTGTLYSLP